jgi:hypothetical protein
MNYEIQLSSGKKIPLYFGTWSISRFCELNGNLSFTAMQELFTNEISFKHILYLMLCGAEHYTRKNKLPFDYTDVDAGDWLDDMGGMLSPKFSELMNVIGKAIYPNYQGMEVTDSKKKEEESLSVGTTSESNVSTAA